MNSTKNLIHIVQSPPLSWAYPLFEINNIHNTEFFIHMQGPPHSAYAIIFFFFFSLNTFH